MRQVLAFHAVKVVLKVAGKRASTHLVDRFKQPVFVAPKGSIIEDVKLFPLHPVGESQCPRRCLRPWRCRSFRKRTTRPSLQRGRTSWTPSPTKWRCRSGRAPFSCGGTGTESSVTVASGMFIVARIGCTVAEAMQVLPPRIGRAPARGASRAAGGPDQDSAAAAQRKRARVWHEGRGRSVDACSVDCRGARRLDRNTRFWGGCTAGQAGNQERLAPSDT